MFEKVITRIFSKHGFEEEFYKPWFKALGAMKSKELQTLIDLLEGASKEELELWTKNLHEKIDALQSGDEESWRAIVQKERKYILE